MGIKKLLGIRPPKEMTEEENREYLMDLGVTVKNPNKKKREKFTAYGAMGEDRRFDKVYAPAGYEQHARSANGGQGTGGGDDDYDDDLNRSVADYKLDDPYDSRNPYSKAGARGGNPYAKSSGNGNSYSKNNDYTNTRSDPYSGSTDTVSSSSSSPYQRGDTNSPYSNTPGNDPYGAASHNNNITNPSPAAQERGIQSSNPYGRRGPSGRNTSGANPNGDVNSSSNHSNINVAPNSNRINISSAANAGANPYSNMSSSSNNVSNPYGDSFDFENDQTPNFAPSAVNRNPYGGSEASGYADDDDLNAAPKQEYGRDGDLNASIHEYEGYTGGDAGNDYNEYDNQGNDNRGYKTFEEIQQEEQAKQQAIEDEEVDEIKQQIRFTKQSSLASTRNTLKMAQDAEQAGMNTLGMLGNQSEKLNDVENNLTLMKIQNRTADDKVKELKKMNRSVFAVHVSNPFTSKRRLREQEEKIKNQRIQDKVMQEHVNQDLYNSTRRVGSAMDEVSRGDEIKERYHRNDTLGRSKRFQFENDEEDDDIEVELDRNLDKIGAISSRLKKLAVAAGEEVDKQQNRIKNIEEDTDDLDIKIHLNTHRLRNIR